jgi:hypothetical protein
MIFFSFATTSLSFVPYQYTSELFGYCNAVVSLSSFFFVSANKFLDWKNKAIRHQSGAEKFLELNSEITNEFLCSRDKRMDGLYFGSWCAKSFRNIRKTLPQPPESILKKLHEDNNPDIQLQKEKRKIFSSNIDSQDNSTVSKNDIDIDIEIASNPGKIEINKYQQFQLDKLHSNISTFTT